MSDLNFQVNFEIFKKIFKDKIDASKLSPDEIAEFEKFLKTSLTEFSEEVEKFLEKFKK